jgi:hypothetical protein
MTGRIWFFEHISVASRTGTLPCSLVRRLPPDTYGSDIEAEDTVTDSSRWGGQLFPDRPSFPSVAKSTFEVSRSALDGVRSGGLIVAKSGLAFVWPRCGMILGSAAALGVFCISIYFAVGYVHYKRAAIDERVAAQRAERANADLQDALDRSRDELATTKALIDPRGDGTQLAVSEQYKADRIAQLTRALEQPRDLRLTDTQRPTLTARRSWETTELTDGNAEQLSAHSGFDQSKDKLQQLSAERDEAVGERDQLRARVGELEQELSLLLQSRRGPHPVAKAAATRTASLARAQAAVAAAIAPAPAPAAVVPTSEHPRQVAVVFPTKNFTPPGWVPTNFSNERAPIRENPTRRPAETNAKE